MLSTDPGRPSIEQVANNVTNGVGPVFSIIGAGQVFLFKLKQHNFRVGTKSQRRPPGPHAARSIHLHLSDPAQTIRELPINPLRHPGPGIELPNVRMS